MIEEARETGFFLCRWVRTGERSIIMERNERFSLKIRNDFCNHLKTSAYIE